MGCHQAMREVGGLGSEDMHGAAGPEKVPLSQPWSGATGRVLKLQDTGPHSVYKTLLAVRVHGDS